MGIAQSVQISFWAAWGFIWDFSVCLNLRADAAQYMACAKPGSSGGSATKCIPCKGGAPSCLKVYSGLELEQASRNKVSNNVLYDR